MPDNSNYRLFNEEVRKGNGFYEPPSSPKELLPKPVGASVHTYRYSTFIREKDFRSIAINYYNNCGEVVSSSKTGQHLVNIFTQNACPVIHIGYLASHQLRWISQGTALGEVAYSLSLAPGETRNIAVIDLRRRQQGRRSEQTEASEQLISNQDHTFALQEVATAVALEHQHGKTATEANTLVSGGAFVAAGAIVGGISGGLIGTLVEPGVGTVVGAGIGAGAGVAAGGLVFAGAQALGMIEAESSGERDVMANTNQRIAQSTSQQSALIRSLWSTVVTEDVQEEAFGVRTSNITNYNHMHALNMEYYEILHCYDTVTQLESTAPILYLPFNALPLTGAYPELIDEFWGSIRTGLSEELQEKGDHVFVEPPPPDFVPELVPPLPDPAPDVTLSDLIIDLDIQWDLEWTDAINALLGFTIHPGLGALMLFADQIFVDGLIEIEINSNTYLQPESVTRSEDFGQGITTFQAKFNQSLDASEITGVRVDINSPADLFDESIYIRLKAVDGTVSPASALSLPGLQIASGDLEYDDGGRGSKIYPWSPLGNVFDEYARKLAEIAAIEQRNAEGEAAHQAVLDQLDQWKNQVIDAVKREPFRFTMIILSSMETGRLTWILDRLYLSGDDENERGKIPLHFIAHTTPIGISGDSVLLKMKSPLNVRSLSELGEQSFILDQESLVDIKNLLNWPDTLAERFQGDNTDLMVKDTVYLPGAGVFAEAILGRSNASEYIDPSRYWNWQDSPIPHQAPEIQPVSTAPRTTESLDTSPNIPDSTIPFATAPNFPAAIGLAGVLQAVQNGALFRDMSKSDQLVSVLGGLTNLASGVANSAASMTGDAAANALSSATDIGKTVASLTEQLIAKAPAQAANPPNNPTTSAAATEAVERSQTKSADVQDATKDAWGIPGSATAQPGGTSAEQPAPQQPWRPSIDSNSINQPGQVSNFPGVPTQIQEEVESEVRTILQNAAEDTGSMPDTSVLVPPMERWYRDSVIPLLVYAKSNEEYLTSAIKQYFEWLGSMQQLGMDDKASELEASHGSGMPLIKVGLENAIRAAFDQMEANNDLDYIIDVLNWIGVAKQQVGFNEQSSPLFSVTMAADHSPIRVILEGPLEPENGVGLGDSYELTLSGGIAIGVNPPLDGKLVQVTITVDGGTATPAQGTIHPALELVSTIERTDDTTEMKIEVKGESSLFQGLWEFETVRAVSIA